MVAKFIFYWKHDHSTPSQTRPSVSVYNEYNSCCSLMTVMKNVDNQYFSSLWLRCDSRRFDLKLNRNLFKVFFCLPYLCDFNAFELVFTYCTCFVPLVRFQDLDWRGLFQKHFESLLTGYGTVTVEWPWNIGTLNFVISSVVFPYNKCPREEYLIFPVTTNSLFQASLYRRLWRCTCLSSTGNHPPE